MFNTPLSNERIPIPLDALEHYILRRTDVEIFVYVYSSGNTVSALGVHSAKGEIVLTTKRLCFVSHNASFDSFGNRFVVIFDSFI